jgi:hypothetical protein
MQLEPFRDFLIACVGASASFIGLLFVALSVVLTRTDEGKLEFSDRRLAESSFTALANVFFISLTALIPGVNIGWVALVVAFFGFRNVWRLFARLREEKDKGDRRSDIFWIITSSLVYVAEAWCAVDIILKNTDVFGLNFMMGILIGLFGTALVRTWELIGIRRN